ncbi:MAG: hypothetical protein NTV01_11385, partial [Bacteroidia bacterium]|nr:hypothetical protein [Bacteroidia bacterium]
MKIKTLGIVFLFFAYGQNIFPAAVGADKDDKSVVIVNVSNPAMPGKLSVIVGDGWDVKSPVIKLIKVENGDAGSPSGLLEVKFLEAGSKILRVVKNEPQVLTCDFPDDQFSVYAVVAKGNKGLSKPVLVNVAKAEWLSKEVASGGDTVRIFGRNLVNLDLYPAPQVFLQAPGYGSYLNAPETKISIEAPDGSFKKCKVVKASAYDIHFILPASLADGSYKIYAHNGLGGKYGWSEPVGLAVHKAMAWPS